jgi:hypothetical protein
MEGSKIWKLMNLHNHQIEKYGDAAFDEYKTPLKGHQPTILSDSATTKQVPVRSRTLPTVHIFQKEKSGTLNTSAIHEKSGTLNTSAIHEKSGTLHTGMIHEKNGTLHTSMTDETSGTLNSSGMLASPGPGPPTSKSTTTPLRSGRTLKRQVFNDSVAQLAFATKAIHLSKHDTTSLGVPTAPFKAIDLKAAMLEDASGWRKLIQEEYESLKKMNAFTLQRGRLPSGRRIIPSCLVLKKKFNTKGETIQLKS